MFERHGAVAENKTTTTTASGKCVNCKMVCIAMHSVASENIATGLITCCCCWYCEHISAGYDCKLFIFFFPKCSKQFSDLLRVQVQGGGTRRGLSESDYACCSCGDAEQSGKEQIHERRRNQFCRMSPSR